MKKKVKITGYTSLGEYVYSQRLLMGLEQKDFAKRTGLSISTISYMEDDVRYPSFAKVSELVRWLISKGAPPLDFSLLRK